MPSASALSEGEKGIPKHYLTPDMSHEGNCKRGGA